MRGEDGIRVSPSLCVCVLFADMQFQLCSWDIAPTQSLTPFTRCDLSCVHGKLHALSDSITQSITHSFTHSIHSLQFGFW